MSAVAVGINKGFEAKPVAIGAPGIDVVISGFRIFDTIPDFIYSGIGANDDAVARAVDCIAIVLRKTYFTLRTFGVVVKSLLVSVVDRGLSRALEECTRVDDVHTFFETCLSHSIVIMRADGDGSQVALRRLEGSHHLCLESNCIGTTWKDARLECAVDSYLVFDCA